VQKKFKTIHIELNNRTVCVRLKMHLQFMKLTFKTQA